MTKIMTVRKVVRFKGTILIGWLECDIKVNEEIQIGDTLARIFAIESCGKLHDSAKTGDEVALMIRNIPDVLVQSGWEITKP